MPVPAIPYTSQQKDWRAQVVELYFNMSAYCQK